MALSDFVLVRINNLLLQAAEKNKNLAFHHNDAQLKIVIDFAFLRPQQRQRDFIYLQEQLLL